MVNEAALSINSRPPEEHTETSRVLRSFTASSSQPTESSPQQARNVSSLYGRVPVFHYKIPAVSGLDHTVSNDRSV